MGQIIVTEKVLVLLNIAWELSYLETNVPIVYKKVLKHKILFMCLLM